MISLNKKEFLETIKIELESFKQIDKDVKKLIHERHAKVEFKNTAKYKEELIIYSQTMSA